MSTVPPDELVDELPDELLDELLLQPTTARATAVHYLAGLDQCDSRGMNSLPPVQRRQRWGSSLPSAVVPQRTRSDPAVVAREELASFLYRGD
jgi:hypothetical protein